MLLLLPPAGSGILPWSIAALAGLAALYFYVLFRINHRRRCNLQYLLLLVVGNNDWLRPFRKGLSEAAEHVRGRTDPIDRMVKTLAYLEAFGTSLGEQMGGIGAVAFRQLEALLARADNVATRRFLEAADERPCFGTSLRGDRTDLFRGVEELSGWELRERVAIIARQRGAEEFADLVKHGGLSDEQIIAQIWERFGPGSC